MKSMSLKVNFNYLYVFNIYLIIFIPEIVYQSEHIPELNEDLPLRHEW